MEENESVVEYLTKVTSVVNQMSSNGEVLDDLRVVQKVIRKNILALLQFLSEQKISRA